MSNVLNAQMLLLIGFCIATESGREFCFKHAADDSSFMNTIKKPMVWLGIVFWIVELVAWTIVLETVPLSIAFPLMAMNYIIVVVVGGWLFKERITRRHVLGSLLITAGVACVGVTGI